MTGRDDLGLVLEYLEWSGYGDERCRVSREEAIALVRALLDERQRPVEREDGEA